MHILEQYTNKPTFICNIFCVWFAALSLYFLHICLSLRGNSCQYIRLLRVPRSVRLLRISGVCMAALAIVWMGCQMGDAWRYLDDDRGRQNWWFHVWRWHCDRAALAEIILRWHMVFEHVAMHVSLTLTNNPDNIGNVCVPTTTNECYGCVRSDGWMNRAGWMDITNMRISTQKIVNIYTYSISYSSCLMYVLRDATGISDSVHNLSYSFVCWSPKKNGKHLQFDGL